MSPAPVPGAEADNPEKAVIVIMTDGLENSSKEITKEGAKAALDRGKVGWIPASDAYQS